MKRKPTMLQAPPHSPEFWNRLALAERMVRKEINRMEHLLNALKSMWEPLALGTRRGKRVK